MQEMKLIYNNDAGTSFFWINDGKVLTNKVQLIFREIGFYFNQQELHLFRDCINESYHLNKCCDDCELRNSCHKFLLKTPCSQIDLAVSMPELKCIKDLVEGVLFKISLNEYIFGVGMN